MRSIKRRFDKIVHAKPSWSSYICFVEAIRGQGFSKRRLHRWFQELVSVNDYATEEMSEVLAHLWVLNNSTEA